MYKGYDDKLVAAKYNDSLRLPIIRTLYKRECRALAKDLEGIVATDKVLEIGAGTGKDTAALCAAAKEVTALEPSLAMMTELRKAIDPLPPNLELHTIDFLAYETSKKFDVVVAVGVLDYVEDWQGFLTKCNQLARKKVVVTLKAKGILPLLYVAASHLSGLKVYTHSADEITRFLPTATIELVGLHKHLPFTWIVSFSPEP